MKHAVGGRLVESMLLNGIEPLTLCYSFNTYQVFYSPRELGLAGMADLEPSAAWLLPE
jgi:hypothetical protein